MATKRPSKRPVWKRSDKAPVAALPEPEGNSAHRRAGADAIEVGARAIYEMRSHPRKARWDELEDDDRAVYRERMQTIVATLNRKHYVIG